MIIVEGPDGTGKTTLAKQLVEDLELEYRRPPSLSSTHGPDDAVIRWWDEEIRKGELAVYDRCFYISEFIYQPNTRDRALLCGADKMVSGLRSLESASPMFIFCLPPFDAQVDIIHQADRDRLRGLDESGEVKVAWMYHYVAHLFGELYFDWTLRYDWMNGDHYGRTVDAVRQYTRAKNLGF